MKISSIISGLLILGSISAQNFVVNAPDTVRIFAVLADFQEDKDNATEGDGTFGSNYSKDYGHSILDPLPHDKTYFEDHLEFAKNYFSKVSNGRFTLEYEVYDQVITVSKTMRNYTSLTKSEIPEKLGEFAQEVWGLVNTQTGGKDFSKYDAFAIFHAGVGGDVLTPGSIVSGRDLPSFYLSEKTLKNVFGSNFQGFPLNSSALVKNTMILPETESREVDGISEKVLLEISINGLIVSSIASHLGLPDLFDTETGKSAIGRFGMMDGQSIFGYSGTFLPEPSAWEKIALGWADPVELNPGNNLVKLTPRVLAGINDTTIVKIPINTNEYYLVERRSRDANADGARFTIKIGDSVFTKKFDKDTSGFYYFDTENLRGVVIDVDEPDWALPGVAEDYDEETDSFQDCGLIIWHIDESIIADNIDDNKINLFSNRGVKLVEADGIDDIGEEYTDILGNYVILEGSREDTWYKENPAKYYDNIFSPESKPNTNANDGTSSLITLSNFSAIAPSMSFNISFGNSSLSLVKRQKLNTQDISDIFLSSVDSSSYYFISNMNLYKVNNDRQELVDLNFSEQKPAIINLGNSELLIGVVGKTLNCVRISNASVTTSEFGLTENITAVPVILSKNTNYADVIAGTEGGKLHTLRVMLNDLSTSEIQGSNISISESVKLVSVYDQNICIAGEHSVSFQEGVVNQFSGTVKKAAFVSDKTVKNRVIVLSGNKFFGIDNNSVIEDISVNQQVETDNFILADLKNDGQNYIVFTSGDKIFAMNSKGSIAGNFPFTDPENLNFTGEMLAGDFNNDGMQDIIAVSENGRIITISGNDGKNIAQLNLSLGENIKCYPEIAVSEGKYYLSALTKSSNLTQWEITNPASVSGWLSKYGNTDNSSSVDQPQTTNVQTAYFPSNSVYNWPNPVYEGSTNIRYYVSENSKVNIKIFDIAGDLVDELNDNATGGFDNETVWNVGQVQSGIYLARVRVESESGKSDEKIIKIAIVK